MRGLGGRFIGAAAAAEGTGVAIDPVSSVSSVGGISEGVSDAVCRLDVRRAGAAFRARRGGAMGCMISLSAIASSLTGSSALAASLRRFLSGATEWLLAELPSPSTANACSS